MEQTALSSHTSRLSPFQIFSLFILACLNMQDGFDILAISFAANAISEGWSMSRAELGIVFSAGLFGMMLGAVFLSPLADKIGRKTITIIGLVLSGIGMIIAALSPTILVLVGGRVLTGLGIGAILASLNTLVAEYAGERYRGLAVASFQIGFPIGAFLSGFIAAWLLDIGSWRHVFGFGAFLSFAFLPLIMILPESQSYLAQSGKPDALERINHIRQKFRQAPLNSLPLNSKRDTTSLFARIGHLFTAHFIVRTFLIWMSFFLLMTTLYFLLSWTPKLMTEMNFSEADGNLAGRIINLLGIPGIILIGLLSLKLRTAATSLTYLAAVSALLLIFGVSNFSLGTTLIFIGLVGFFVNGAMIGLYQTVSSLYPVSIRTTGTGWAIGLSRLGAIFGPSSAGFLLDAGWSVQQLFQFFAIPVALAAICCFLLWQIMRRPNFST